MLTGEIRSQNGLHLERLLVGRTGNGFITPADFAANQNFERVAALKAK